ncbi:phosphoglycerate mutase-like protein [Jackrogersella minutella]|nr:phosphoglycerate mutase-like protein [Jackrogersella minutella]
MRILLIRHGESVDNIAGLYAGSRDSSLTNHGVLQTKRLGAHLAKRHETLGSIKYIFTSNLQRAYQTAQAIAEALAEAQFSSSNEPENQTSSEVSRLSELREKDYGSSEGKKYGLKIRKDSDRHVQSDSETHESMRTRIDQFLNSHLIPIIDTYASNNVTVAIVAHGIILGVLLKALLDRFPTKSAASTSQSGSRDNLPEFAAWSNTGVLQAKLELDGSLSASDKPSKDVPQASSIVSSNGDTGPVDSHEKALRLTIEFTNNLEHLEGLKKTRGGIGSAKFDTRQRTMDSFFGPSLKKRKLEETTNAT